jgi:hypothetical protein
MNTNTRLAWPGPPAIEHYSRGSYHVFSITEDIDDYTSLSLLQMVIKNRIENDMRENSRMHFAVKFTENSSLSTRVVTQFLQCYEIIADASRTCAVITSNSAVQEIFATFFPSSVKIVNTEEELEEAADKHISAGKPQ